jgi:hypothetical protein
MTFPSPTPSPVHQLLARAFASSMVRFQASTSNLEWSAKGTRYPRYNSHHLPLELSAPATTPAPWMSRNLAFGPLRTRYPTIFDGRVSL